MNIEQLQKDWVELKATEDKAKKLRLEVEKKIVEISDLPEKGTKEICNGLKVTTGMSISYDQDALMKLYRSGKIPNFPFKKEFKPVAAELKYLSDNFPEQFDLIEECATSKPKKPAFKAS